MSNDVDRVRVAYCGLCLGIGKIVWTQLKLEHAVLVYMQCVLAVLWSVASRLAETDLWRKVWVATDIQFANQNAISSSYSNDSMLTAGQTFLALTTYWGFPTKMVYLYYISCLRYTMLVGNSGHYYCYMIARHLADEIWLGNRRK